MVKFRFMLIAILLVSASANMSAAWRIVFDRNCLKIVMANTASQKLIEEQHNQRVDTIAAKKQKVELYTVSMATMKELYKLKMCIRDSIYTDLNRIRYKVEGMVLMAQYATANDLFFAIDPEGWENVVTMKNHVRCV